MGIGPRRLCFPRRARGRARAAVSAIVVLSAMATASGAPVSEAASFYHQGRFDSALARLEALQPAGDMKRRDSLSLFQYLGMASARLGRVPEAEGYFTTLLGLDSLFQFPRNEDPAVLAAFASASALRSIPPAPPTVEPQGPSGPEGSLAKAPPAAPTPATRAIPQGRDYGEAKPLVLAGMTLTEIGATGVPGETGVTGRRVLSDPPRIGLALGAMPFGTGWFVRNKFKHGLVLGILQTGGLVLSVYSSNMRTRIAGDPFRIEDMEERDDADRWQWVQRASLSTAVGAYVYSLIASAGD